MSRRKKRRRGSEPEKSSKSKRDDEGFGTLADKLADIDVATREAPSRQAPTHKAPPPPKEPPTRKLTPEEAMREAFESAGRDAHFRKFSGGGFELDEQVVVADKEAPAPAPTKATTPYSRDDMTFFEAMGGDVEPLSDKYAELRTKQWQGAHWHDERQLAKWTPAQLREPDLTGEQRDRLRRSRRGGAMPVINIRRQRRSEAMNEVEAFVIACAARRDRFVRIVTGKGKQSEGDPVLKPAVIAWCQGAGSRYVLGWAPETDRSGQFGSVVLELQTRKRR